MVGNIIENIIDQRQKDTLVEYASAFDFRQSISLEDQIILIKKLHSIYCLNYSHTVENVKENVWKNYRVEITYSAKIDCDEEVIIKEFENSWPILSRNWPKFRNDGKLANLNMIQHVLENYLISHPNLCELLQLILSVSSPTGPLERSFSKLAKICYKDRNQLKSENIKTLYLLSALKEPMQTDYRWNKHERDQYSSDIFVKNVFNPFHGTGLFLYSLKYMRKPEIS